MRFRVIFVDRVLKDWGHMIHELTLDYMVEHEIKAEPSQIIAYALQAS